MNGPARIPRRDDDDPEHRIAVMLAAADTIGEARVALAISRAEDPRQAAEAILRERLGVLLAACKAEGEAVLSLMEGDGGRPVYMEADGNADLLDAFREYVRKRAEQAK